MADIQKLTDLDPDEVATNLAILQNMLAELYPNIDLTASSVFTQQVLRPAALFHTLNTTNLNNLRRSRSLLAILNDTSLADADATIVDHVLSNYNVTRNTSAAATGKITIIAESDSFMPIGTSVTFNANGIDFHTTTNYAGLPDSASVNDPSTEFVFIQRTDGTYAISIPVKAATTGRLANVPRGTRFTVTPSIGAVVDIVAADGFSGGVDEEATADLLPKLAAGLSQKSVASRGSLRALIQSAYPNVTDVSVIGAGDAELQRAGHNTLGIKPPGWVDIYVRTAKHPRKETVKLTATLVNKTNKYWQLQLNRDQYAGLYELMVLPLNTININEGLTIVEHSRAIDTTITPTVQFVPDIADIQEGWFSRYQTVSVIFQDTYTNTDAMTEGVSTKDYNVVVTYMPDIADISDWLTGRSVRHVGADMLVKAPIPCFVSVGLKVIKGRGDQVLTADNIQEIQSYVADAVNSVDFATGRLDASVIINAIQEKLPKRTRVQTPIDLRGRLVYPDGTTGWLINQHALIPPDRSNIMCSPRTVAFYLDPTKVSITVVDSTTLPV